MPTAARAFCFGKVDAISQNAIIQSVGKHEKTLAAIFADPIRANLRWADIESLLEHLGATIESREGSRIHVTFNGFDASFHRPHPSPKTKKATVKSVRRFLAEAGVMP